MAIEHPAIFDSAARLSDDERRILLLGLKLLYGDIQFSRVAHYPVDPVAIKVLVTKLGGRAELL